jgi:hypothetical protein
MFHCLSTVVPWVAGLAIVLQLHLVLASAPIVFPQEVVFDDIDPLAAFASCDDSDQALEKLARLQECAEDPDAVLALTHEEQHALSHLAELCATVGDEEIPEEERNDLLREVQLVELAKTDYLAGYTSRQGIPVRADFKREASYRKAVEVYEISERWAQSCYVNAQEEAKILEGYTTHRTPPVPYYQQLHGKAKHKARQRYDQELEHYNKYERRDREKYLTAHREPKPRKHHARKHSPWHYIKKYKTFIIIGLVILAVALGVYIAWPASADEPKMSPRYANPDPPEEAFAVEPFQAEASLETAAQKIVACTANIAEFAAGLPIGLYKGAKESLGNTWHLATAMVQDPIGTSTQIIDGAHALLSLVQEGHWSQALDQTFPKVKPLCQTWSSLSAYEQGLGVGECLGEYGCDFFTPTVVTKGIGKVAKLAKGAVSGEKQAAKILKFAQKGARPAGSLPHLEIKEVARKMANGHGFQKHVIRQREFPGMTRAKYQNMVEEIMAQPSEIRGLRNGRRAYWDESRKVVVVYDPNAKDCGSAFKPREGYDYFSDVLK